MLKSLKKNNTITTPFVSTKRWALSNTENDDLVLTETDDFIVLEFVDYGDGSGYPVLNTDCFIALEQQDNDKLKFREGQKITGIFYPDQDPINSDGTYKRLVHSQIRTMFYNNYRDPTKMWGLENIDFENSQVKRFITENIRVFDIPQRVFGEKVLETTVKISDNTIDNNFTITDDGHNNLFAGTNLFSRFQEIGDFTNEFVTGSATNCSAYFNFNTASAPISLSAVQDFTAPSSSAFISWIDISLNEDGFVVEKSTDSGVTYSTFAIVGANVTGSHDDTVVTGNTYFYRAYSFNSFGSSSFSNTASVHIVGITMDLTSITFDNTNIKMDNV